jgi:hypothetical protein
MEYRTLLLKYMEYITDTEGTDYTGKTLEFSNLFSTDEKQELRELSRTVGHRMTTPPIIRKK